MKTAFLFKILNVYKSEYLVLFQQPNMNSLPVKHSTGHSVITAIHYAPQTSLLELMVRLTEMKH